MRKVDVAYQELESGKSEIGEGGGGGGGGVGVWCVQRWRWGNG